MSANLIRLSSLNIIFTAYILAALIVLALITYGIIDDTNKSLREAAVEADKHVKAVSESIAIEVASYRHEASLLINERQSIFDKLFSARDPDDLIFDFADVTNTWFPRALAFTVGDANGIPIVSDFKGSLGEACRQDLALTATRKIQIVPLHGLSSIPHFDITVPITTSSGKNGVFLITFTLEQLTPLLNRHDDPRLLLELGSPEHHNKITNSSQHPKTADASYTVAGTGIVVYGHIRPEFIKARQDQQWIRLTAYSGGFLVFACLAGWMLWKARKRIMDDAEALRAMNVAMYNQSVVDPLTDLSNRRRLDEHLNRARTQGQRDGKSMTIAIIDIDHFKQINDKLGHDAGDTCLVLLAGILKNKTQRPLDLAIRMGGEEFLICWYDTDIEQARNMASEIQNDLRQSTFKHHDGSNVTVSIGLRHIPNTSVTSLHDLLVQADQALYQAKERGRDRIEISS